METQSQKLVRGIADLLSLHGMSERLSFRAGPRNIERLKEDARDAWLECYPDIPVPDSLQKPLDVNLMASLLSNAMTSTIRH